jgi:hypothetical protein
MERTNKGSKHSPQIEKTHMLIERAIETGKLKVKKGYLIPPQKLIDWALDKQIVLPENLTHLRKLSANKDLNEILRLSFIDKNFPEELGMALNAWFEIYYKKNNKYIKKLEKHKDKKIIEDWLKEKYGNKIKAAGITRIAIALNPDKKPGPRKQNF